uniref:chaplin family protein n=1 Tax=Agromyces subbeticus TaxID=293890 RepID=UPI0003B38FE6
MKKLLLRALYATLFAGGLTLLGAGVAHASETTGDDGILSGTQAGLSLDLPITLSGNAISVIGDSSSQDATTEVVSGDAAEPAAVT